MVSIFNLTPMEIVAIAAIVGISFALPLSTDEDAVFGNVLDLAAEMVFIIAAQRILIKNTLAAAPAPAKDSAANLQRQINKLQCQVAKRSAVLKRCTATGSPQNDFAE
ncbi:MAG TPA: hypothetical protein PKA28_19475 [Methylomusa anaerophila]|uniref:Uncharacterized protein n=1 Tax=Methylomusa anaerophila TaxID=1930071 RepID=A0A348AIK0_9FIRM|nr:hypothetical protein [Methylomusa anaerophila]BBB90898.1 hypothetical protein MAMMFC1_01565 [Methylomusa anaerophila]HML90617.1 hypothetical protein [Methylomusa anaerophila]